MLLQPQKYAKNPQYTIASVECTALPHANATIWYIALLLCSEAPAPAPSISLSVSEPEEFVPYTPVSAPAKEQPVKVVPESKSSAMNGMFENYDDVIEFIKRKR